MSKTLVAPGREVNLHN